MFFCMTYVSIFKTVIKNGILTQYKKVLTFLIVYASCVGEYWIPWDIWTTKICVFNHVYNNVTNNNRKSTWNILDYFKN